MDTPGLGMVSFVSFGVAMARVTAGKGEEEAELVRLLEAVEHPYLFIRSHHNKPSVAFPQPKIYSAASKKLSCPPMESIILIPSTLSNSGTELKEQ